MKTMKYYHDLYLKWDILPLTDVFKKLEIIAKELWITSKSLFEFTSRKLGCNG